MQKKHMQFCILAFPVSKFSIITVADSTDLHVVDKLREHEVFFPVWLQT